MEKINITLISAYLYLSALVMLSFSFMDFFARSTAINLFSTLSNATEMQFIIGGIVFLIIGLFDILIGYKISKGSNTFRVMVIIISVLGFIWSVFGIIAYSDTFSILFLAINSYILYALVFSKPTVEFFK